MIFHAALVTDKPILWKYKHDLYKHDMFEHDLYIKMTNMHKQIRPLKTHDKILVCEFVATPSPPEKPEKIGKEGEREEGESLIDAEKEKEKGREGKEGENTDSTESKEVIVWLCKYRHEVLVAHVVLCFYMYVYLVEFSRIVRDVLFLSLTLITLKDSEKDTAPSEKPEPSEGFTGKSAGDSTSKEVSDTIPLSPKAKGGKEKGGEEESSKKEAGSEKMNEDSSSELPAIKDEKQGRLRLSCA